MSQTVAQLMDDETRLQAELDDWMAKHKATENKLRNAVGKRDDAAINGYHADLDHMEQWDIPAARDRLQDVRDRLSLLRAQEVAPTVRPGRGDGMTPGSRCSDSCGRCGRCS